MPRLSQSAQARWSRRKKAAGNCARCGKPRGQYKHLCDRCQGLKAAYMRRWRAARKQRATQTQPTVVLEVANASTC